MSQKNVKLTTALVNGYKPKDKGYRVFDSTVTGLALYVGTSGAKSWSLNYTDRHGKRQSYRIGTTKSYSVVEARTAARKLLNDIATGHDPAAEKREAIAFNKGASARALGTYLEGDYWDHYLSKQKSGDFTIRRIRSSFKPFLGKDMAKITSQQLTQHRTRRHNDGITPQSLNRDRVALHALFVRAVKDKLITHNPANKVDHAPMDTAEEKRVRYLGQHDEIEGNAAGSERTRFMSALGTMPDQFQAIIKLALLTGCRRGELFNLKWADVSLRNTTVTVTAHSAKTSKPRHIPLNGEAVDIFKSLRGSNVVSIDKDALVFPHEITGKRLESIYYLWQQLVDKAKVVDFHHHDCRHDFASRLVMAGVELIAVRDLLGHSTITMTERYSHLAPETLRSAIDKLGAL